MKQFNQFKFILAMLMFPLLGFGQNEAVNLQQCKTLAKENFSKLKQIDLQTKITELKNKNIKSGYLPVLELKGQATYQSEVIEFDLPIPGFNFEPVSNDQYKVYIDFKQTIWDGGISKSLHEIESVVLDLNLQKIEMEVRQVYTMVENYFFSILMLDRSLSVISAQIEIVEAQAKRLESAVLLGSAREKDKLKLEVELLSIRQKQQEIASNKLALVEMLNVLTGESYTESTQFIYDEAVHKNADQKLSPELRYFGLQQTQLQKSDMLLSSTRNPKLFGFGQAGYGKPGFNMLKNEFDTYYIVGLGLSWQLTDWNQTKRKKEINEQQFQLVTTLEQDFAQKQAIQLAEVSRKIDGLEQLIETDMALLEGRMKIVKSSAAELENGTINSTDYLMELSAETIAKINHEMHKIQRIQSITKYNSILGY